MRDRGTAVSVRAVRRPCFWRERSRSPKCLISRPAGAAPAPFPPGWRPGTTGSTATARTVSRMADAAMDVGWGALPGHRRPGLIEAPPLPRSAPTGCSALPGHRRPGLIEALAPAVPPSRRPTLPGHRRPGLIEANGVNDRLDRLWVAELFRGIVAPASLKRSGSVRRRRLSLTALPGHRRPGLIEAGVVLPSAMSASTAELFRGIVAPASLKRDDPRPMGHPAAALFRGIVAPASLKRMTDHPQATVSAPSSGASSPRPH